MQVTSTRFMPLLVSTSESWVDPEHLLEDLTEGIAVGYSYGPPYGQRLVTWSDLERMGADHRTVRRSALEHLYDNLDKVRIHGQPPALMLSFGGLESSVLLADVFWESLAPSVPGELVVGVPVRDVVIITGSHSPPGLEKARRAVDRVLYAGDRYPLSRELLVWRNGWEPLRAPTPGPLPPSGPAMPAAGYRPPAPRQPHRWEQDPPWRHPADSRRSSGRPR